MMTSDARKRQAENEARTPGDELVDLIVELIARIDRLEARVVSLNKRVQP